MEKHHKDSIEIFLNKYTKDETILALLLAGSIAHGFAKPESDIDIIIIVDEKEYQKRKKEKKLAFSLWDICTYDGGYVDCKVISIDFLKLVAGKGSDPARYAFKDNIVLFSRINDLDDILKKIAMFSHQEKDERRKRFISQLLAWKWFYSEAVKKQNNYLLYLALQKVILFSCRIVLNENNMLYPYHKWLISVISKAKEKPKMFDALLKEIMENHSLELVNQIIDETLEFLNLKEKEIDWPNQFLLDSEWNWVNNSPPVDDI